MWSEWLTRTLNARRLEKAADEASARKERFAGPPDLEGDGMHPGADEFRAAPNRCEEE